MLQTCSRSFAATLECNLFTVVMAISTAFHLQVGDEYDHCVVLFCLEWTCEVQPEKSRSWRHQASAYGERSLEEPCR
jgi:hypothetical protein